MSENGAVATESAVEHAPAETTTGADYSKSDVELLGGQEGVVNDFGVMEALPKPTVEPQPEGEAQRGAEPAKLGEQPQPGVEPEKVELDKAAEAAIPAEWKPWMKADPRLRDTVYSERAYREAFPTVRAAREAAQIAQQIGSVEEFADIARSALDKTEIDRIVLTGSPAERLAMFSQPMSALGPDESFGLAADAVIALQQAHPQAYAELVRQIASEALPGGEGRGADDGQLDELLGEAAPRRNEEADRLRAELDQMREQSSTKERQAVEQAEMSTATQARDTFVSSALDLAAKALPNSDEGAQRHIAGLLLRNIVARLADSPGYHARVAQARMVGGPAAAAKVFLGQAERLAPSVLREILGWWATEALRVNRGTVEAKQAAASRKEVGPGGAPAPEQTPRGRINYQRMTDRDLLDQ
jgi:hypothetical protein